jgi:hypothetical protein
MYRKFDPHRPYQPFSQQQLSGLSRWQKATMRALRVAPMASDWFVA